MDPDTGGGVSQNTRETRTRPQCASVVIASRGKEAEITFSTRYGVIRSRAAADLQYTAIDARRVFDLFTKEDDELPTDLHQLLIDPSLKDVEGTIEAISSRLRSDYRNDVGLDLFFAGHGETGTGNLILKDGCLSPTRFLRVQSGDVGTHLREKRTLGVWLDSCYSGAFLIRLALDAGGKTPGFVLDEGLASCLPDEQCFEMKNLEHGVFTYTRLYPGNQHVDSERFNRAILQNDQVEIAKGLQGLVGSMSSPAAFLTQGKQFPISLTKYVLDVIGGFSNVELHDKSDFAEVAGRLSRFKHSRARYSGPR